jgi:D-alanine-D-alanine ligase
MIMDSKNNIHILEINTSPGMTEQSLCPLEIRAEGKEFSDLLSEIIDLSKLA